jgi:hypothetical protein
MKISHSKLQLFIAKSQTCAKNEATSIHEPFFGMSVSVPENPKK